VLRVCFWVHGFVLLIALALWADVRPVMLGQKDQIAHWAHLGGFGSGILLAVALLVARQVRHHGDAISVMLGKYAWPLVGRPIPVPKEQPAPAALPPAAAPLPAAPALSQA
jgi:hypothetical protein